MYSTWYWTVQPLAEGLGVSVRAVELSLAALVALVLLIYLFERHRCPTCGRWFTLRDAGTDGAAEYDVERQPGDHAGRREDLIFGKRRILSVKVVVQCSACGASRTRTHSEWTN